MSGLKIKRRGQELKIVLGGIAARAPRHDLDLIQLIAKAYLLRTELERAARGHDSG